MSERAFTQEIDEAGATIIRYGDLSATIDPTVALDDGLLESIKTQMLSSLLPEGYRAIKTAEFFNLLRLGAGLDPLKAA